MSQFSEFIERVEAAAVEAIQQAENEGLALVQELVPLVEDALSQALADFGALASSLILKFMQEEFDNLTGREKHGQVVTNIVQEAEVQGKALAILDANTLVKNLFLAITSHL